MDKEKKIAEIREALERAKGKYTVGTIVDSWCRFLLSELERLEQEHDKLIEVLRWYADVENQKLDEGTRHWENVYSPYEMDGGQRARSILKKIGVTVE